MKAVVQDEYGPPEVLSLREIDRPVAGDDEVLIRVHAAGLEQGVWHVMAGMPYMVRLMGFGVRAPKTPVRGTEVAGVVEAVGRNVTRFAPGDEVFGVGDGTFAEYTCAREAKLAPKPANATFEQAAAVPVSGATALQALRDTGRLRAGQRVLVIGAGGGVGSFAVQLAKAFGAEVTGVCSAAKADFVRSLGADAVIDYTREDFADGRAALRRHRRHGGQPVARPSAPRARGQGSARDRRRRVGQPLDRRLRAPDRAGARAVALRGPAACGPSRRRTAAPTSRCSGSTSTRAT